ncbi:MAG: dTDP-4-dehydrorhamnose 3,5-epimerase [Candidatus Omnitrophica bacterium]|nr:dTDP-4-dehydrorhamnose 3,5-epimerase [Candidatus Omnitrophota bacterium]
MKFTPLEIPEVILIEPQVFKDARGFFFEDYNQEVFQANGIHTPFIQDNHSLSRKGVIRGLHYQRPPKAQAKLVRVIRGQVFDVVVDIRKNSKTFGRFVATTLSAENRKMIYIPEGFAHGFCALEDGTEVLYKVSAAYSASHEQGLLWNDPALGIPWPSLNGSVILSEKDRCHPTLKELKH